MKTKSDRMIPMPVQMPETHALQTRAVEELDAMLTMGRRNLETIAALSQLATDSIQQCADGQVQAWNSLCRNALDLMSKPAWASGSSPAAARTPELMGMIDSALAQLRRLSEIIARANNGTLELIHSRAEGCLREIEEAAERTIRPAQPAAQPE